MRPDRLFLLCLLVIAGARSIATADNPRPEAARFVAQSYERFRSAEGSAEGWAPIYEEGIALAERAIAVDPRSAEAHYAVFVNLGRFAERSGRSAQMRAIGRLKEQLARTLELDPNHAHAWAAQGEMLLRLPWVLGGSDEDGEKALRRAAELAPRWAKPQVRLAQYHWQKGRPEEARPEAERARDLARAAGDQISLGEVEELLTKISADLP